MTTRAGWRSAGGRAASLAVWLLALLVPAAALACPTCKEALFDPGELPQRLSTARGYALSIGLLLAMPLGLVGGGSVLILRAQRRKRQAGDPQAGRGPV